MNDVGLGIVLQAGGGQGPVDILLLVVPLFAIWFLLIVRPQQKKQREHEDLLKTVQKGDRIVTSGGLHGVVVGAADDVLTVDFGVHERVRVKLDRSRVERVEKEKDKGKGEQA